MIIPVIYMRYLSRLWQDIKRDIITNLKIDLRVKTQRHANYMTLKLFHQPAYRRSALDAADIRALLSGYSQYTIMQKLSLLYSDIPIIWYILGKRDNKYYINKYELSMDDIHTFTIYNKYKNIRYYYDIHRWNNNEFIWLYCIDYGEFRISRGETQFDHADNFTISGPYIRMEIYSNCIIMRISAKKYRYEDNVTYNLFREYFKKISKRSHDLVFEYKKMIRV